MKITASVTNEGNHHFVIVKTNESEKTLNVAAKSSGNGSSVNGGEFLCLALATCFCNDLYREALKRGMKLNKVTVDAWAEFGGEGESGYGFSYQAHVAANATAEEISDLIRSTDRVAEIQKTLRDGAGVRLLM
ncbi:OsmC family protein [Chryseolinea sp. T2]|uniref:OsmC family protein n=1 Tax=Chryseolinea sp. T2 TaxID=3129255 RepID=UPI003076E0B6